MINDTTTSSNKKVKSKTHYLTTEVFKDRKDVPEFVKTHNAFITPHKLQKIFPSIGLKNFKEPCDLAKPLVDLKKENFITNLIVVMHTALVNARDLVTNSGDEIQYLMVGEEREKELNKLDEIYKTVHLVKGVIPQLDHYDNGYDRIIQTSDGKIVLKLAENINDTSGKIAFKKGEGLFKIFAKLREQFTSQGFEFINLDQAPEFKTFSIENIPNKRYSVVFSSDGPEGAWDILTMSMRGIKSCQRWDGDYPRCLIGSVLSKFVGLIYITSGADIDITCTMPLTGETIKSKGSKMMRRAVVRYAIDADEQKPCLLIDRLYPQQAGADVDEETLKVFQNALSSKTSLPVHFAPKLGHKSRHFYIPFEKIRETVSEREWTYQDTAIKTSLDFQLHVLSSISNEDINRYINCFKIKLITQMGEGFRLILENNKVVSEDVRRILSNIRLNATSMDKFNEKIVEDILGGFMVNLSKSQHPKQYYHKYLVQLCLQLKNIRNLRQNVLIEHINAATSKKVDHKVFYDYLFNNLIKNIIISELKTLIS